jgi:EmrB/QacA subfamily drug resistance transporter
VVFALTCVGAFLVSLDVSIANVTLPAMGRGFHGAGRAGLSWVITAYAIAFAAALVPGGRVADRAGRRRIFAAGLSTFAAGSLICALAPALWVVVLGRVVQGVGAAAAAPASLGLLLAASPDERRSHMTARWGGTGALGIALGPVVGGAITVASDWRWAFFVNLPIVAVVVAATPRYLTETTRHPGRRLPDPLGALLLAVGAALLVLAISEAEDWHWLDFRTGAALLGGGLILLGFVARCRAVADPLLDLALLRNRHFALASVVTVFYSASFFGLLFTFVLFLTTVWRLTLVEAGLGICPMAIIVVTLSTRVGAVAGRYGFRPPLMAGVALMAAGLLLDAALLGEHERFVSQWLPVVLIIGLGIGLCYPLLGAAAVARMPMSEIAGATAVNQCARQLGAALGVAVAVAALGTGSPAAVTRFHLAWTLGAGFAVLAAIAAAALPRMQPAQHAEERRAPPANRLYGSGRE